MRGVSDYMAKICDITKELCPYMIGICDLCELQTTYDRFKEAGKRRRELEEEDDGK